MLLIDSKVGFGDMDIQLAQILGETHKKVLIVFTKCDRIKQSQANKLIMNLEQDLRGVSSVDSTVHFTSAK